VNRRFALPACALALAVVLGACATPIPPAAPAVATPAADALGRIKAAKAINVAFAGDSLPFAFVGPDNQPAGYSIDLCKQVIAAIGRATGEPNLAVRWKVGTTAERLAMVGDGRAELECGNTTPTISRMNSVDFSNLVFVDASGFLVRGDARIGRAAELSGKRIAVIAGTTNEASLERALRQHSIAAQVVRVREAGEAIALLEAGGADAFAGDKLKLVGAAAQAREPKMFALLPDDLSFEPYAFALPRNDTAMRATVNGALGELFRGPELDRIFARWFGMLGRPSQLLGAMYLLSITPE
jgi:glutamate/aspartate transport system substrate-binding protein